MRFWERRHLVDVVPAAISLLIALVATVVNPETESFGTPSASAVALAVVGSLALLGRRRFPIAVLVFVIVLRVVMAAGVGNEFALLPAVVIALFTVARSGSRRSALMIALAAAVAMAILVAAADAEESIVHEALGELAIGLLPVAIADGARSRSDRIRDLIDGEAEARVQAERLRIARDLHDVVAHGLSTIAVQSGVASHLLDRNPKQAREALDIINATGKRSLEELRTMVGVLRSTDEAPLMPTPADPDDLSAVLDGARQGGTGIDIELQVDGSFPAAVSEAAVVAVHRILSEALANVARHGGGAAALVQIDHGASAVDLTISNDGPVEDSTRNGRQSSTGVGIIGMRERAESLGGELRASAMATGGFQVSATIPYHRAAAERGFT